MDPFYSIQDEIRDKLQTLSRHAKEAENRDNVKVVNNELAQLEADLHELEGTVRTVEVDPSKFPLISTFELRQRREFIEDTRHEVNRLKHTIISTNSNGQRSTSSQPKSSKQTSQHNNNYNGSSANNLPNTVMLGAPLNSRQFPSSSSRAIDSDAPKTSFFGMQRDQQQLLLAEQDRTLDELASATERLNQTALIVNTELIDQQRMLEELDEEIERETEHMNSVMRTMAKVFKTSNRRQLCTILWLFIFFVFLLLLVIS